MRLLWERTLHISISKSDEKIVNNLMYEMCILHIIKVPISTFYSHFKNVLNSTKNFSFSNSL